MLTGWVRSKSFYTRHVFRVLVCIIVFCGQILVSSAEEHAARKDVRILVDASTMANLVDKTELRKVLVEATVGMLANEGDFVGVWAFGKKTTPLLPYAVLTENGKQALSAEVGGIRWTDVERNLRRALAAVSFANSEVNQSDIILVTGGGNATGSSIRNALLDDYILNVIAPVLRKKGIKLHVIELANQAESFYQQLLKRVNGKYLTLEGKPDKLYSAISYLARMNGSTAEYTANNQFAITSALDSLGVIVSGVPPHRVVLSHPEGWRLTAKDTPASIKWSQFSSNSLIRITSPALMELPKAETFWQVEGTGRRRALLIGKPVSYLASVVPDPSQLISLKDRRPKPDFSQPAQPAPEQEEFADEFDFGTDFNMADETSGWFKGELGLEARLFSKEGLNGQDRASGSARVQPEIDYLTESGTNLYEMTLFARFDSDDEVRSHFDIRELTWTHIGENSWEVKLGIGKVFWGVTESQHLVDIVNQTDFVENPDGEDKLGQPMVKLAYESEWGNFDFYWLWRFRERTFPGVDGRLGLPIEIATDKAKYASEDKQANQDVAFRYANYWGALEYAVSWFSGTNREPDFLFNGDLQSPRLIPYYTTIDQAGLEVQYIWDDWLLKFEGISRSGAGDRYSAAAVGFEFTQVGIFDTAMDLGWLVEYLWDDRGDRASTRFEHDWFVGWRWTANDEDATEALLGAIWDPESNDTYYSAEASRRIGQNMKIVAEARVFSGGAPFPQTIPGMLRALASTAAKYKSSIYRKEDYAQFEFIYYF